MTFPIRPIAKERARTKLKGHTYTPPRTREFEASVRRWWGDHAGVITPGDVAVEISLRGDSFDVIVTALPQFPATILRGDVDNYVKSVLDALNGHAFTDDRKVRRLVVTK